MRTPSWLSVLMVCGVAAAGCHSTSQTPSGQVSGSATSTTPTHAPPPIPPAVSDQAGAFFPGPRDVEGLNLGQGDRDHLSQLYALRQIDPCGFVDQQALTAEGRENFSYNYSAKHTIVYGAASPLQPIGGEGCTIAFPDSETGLSIELWPGEPRWNDRDFHPDPAHPGIEMLETRCQFRVHLPLAGLNGAPSAMRDPAVAVTPVDLTKDRWSVDDASLCRLAETVAAQAAAQVHDGGVPLHAERDAIAAKFLTSDPCAAASDVVAVGLIWEETAPAAQWPITWRHAGVCHLRLNGGDPNASSAVIRRGLAVWTEDIVSSSAGSVQPSEQDGMTLLAVTPDRADTCSSFVVVKTGAGVEPIEVGPHAPSLDAVTPVVAVELNTPEGTSCTDVARQAAVDTARKALGD